MNNELKIFENEQFGKVRVILINNEPWFVGKDVAEVLGYTTLQRMYDHVDKEYKKKIDPQNVEFTSLCENGTPLESNPNVRTLVIINESGLYDAIFGSILPVAKKFRKWVTSEVFPSIRKNGMYATDELINNPDLLIQVATKLKEEKEKNKKLEEENKEMKPKAEFYDTVTESDTTIDMAKVSNFIIILSWIYSKIFFI